MSDERVANDPGRMHDDEVMTDVALVRRLLADQFPQWARLPVDRVRSTGTDNAIYRIGDDLVARLPRIEAATTQVQFEYDWLPRLAPHLPVAVPEPVALGKPGAGYPWPWAINRWLDGDNPTAADASTAQFATDLGRIVAAFRRIDPTGARSGYRTAPLHTRDDYVREWTPKAADMVDPDAVLAAWDEALAAPEWDRPPVWTHGDFNLGNLLMRNGRISALIDFGCAGVGDPACEAAAAWQLFTPRTRQLFRAEAGFDDATWVRGRGWALTAVGGIAYYRETSPALSEGGRRTINAVLADR